METIGKRHYPDLELRRELIDEVGGGFPGGGHAVGLHVGGLHGPRRIESEHDGRLLAGQEHRSLRPRQADDKRDDGEQQQHRWNVAAPATDP